MKPSSLSIIVVVIIVLIALVVFSVEKFTLPSVVHRFVPHPSATKYFPIKDDPYEDLRINSAICMTENKTLSPVCTPDVDDPSNQDVASLSCKGPRKDKQTGKVVVCEYKSPILNSNFLDNQLCVTNIPGNIEAGWRKIYYTQDDLVPQICSKALADNSDNRLNIVEMLKLVQTSPGSGYPNVSNALFRTTTRNDGVGLEMLADIQNGSVGRWYISNMGHGYKVGDTITLSGGRENAVWKVINVDVFPAVLPVNGKNIIIPDQGEHPRELIKYLYNPYNLDRLESETAFQNACNAVCTNEIDRCYDNCFSAQGDVEE